MKNREREREREREVGTKRNEQMLSEKQFHGQNKRSVTVSERNEEQRERGRERGTDRHIDREKQWTTLLLKILPAPYPSFE